MAPADGAWGQVDRREGDGLSRIALEDIAALPPLQAARVLGLLYYELHFAEGKGWLGYADVFSRLGIERTSNPSMQIKRIRERLETLLPAGSLVWEKHGRSGRIALAGPHRIVLTQHGQPVTEAGLAAFLRLERPRRGVHRPRLVEGDLVACLRSVVQADLSVSSGSLEASSQAVRDLHAMATGRRHGPLRLWASLQELRLLRLGEEWGALKRAVQRVRLRVKREAELDAEHKETLQAAADISAGWLEYHSVRTGQPGSYASLLQRLEPMGSMRLSANSLWMQCDRYNLMALALRRMAVGDEAAPPAQRREWATRSLDFNQEAMQLASLGGNQLLLANYMSNRALLLAELAGATLIDGACNGSPTVWADAVRWLGLGEDLTRGLNAGLETLWSGPFLLTIARYARGHATWRELHRALREYSAWYAGCSAHDVIEAALAFALPAMDNMITVATGTRFDYQLTTFCGCLAESALADRRALSTYPQLAPLRAWAMVRCPRAADAQREVDAFLARFSTAH